MNVDILWKNYSHNFNSMELFGMKIAESPMKNELSVMMVKWKFVGKFEALIQLGS